MKKLSQLLKESQELDYRRMNVGEEEGQGMTKEEKRAFVEAVAAYRQLGEMISHKGNLAEIHESIKGIVESANNITLKETGDWFDRVTVQRHMKSMNESFKVFSSTLKEVSTLQQRLESTYDEIGEVLGKYYEIKEGNEFGAERAKAIASGDDTFNVGGKSFKVTDVDAQDKKNAEEFVGENMSNMKLGSFLKNKKSVNEANDKLMKVGATMVVGGDGSGVVKPVKMKLVSIDYLPKEDKYSYKFQGGGRTQYYTDDVLAKKLKENVNEAKVIVHNEKTGEKHEVLSGKGKGDLLIAMKALQSAAPSHMKYSIKESHKISEDLSAELPKATIPAAIEQRLMLAIQKIESGKLNFNQKIQLLAKVVDALNVDKNQLGTLTSKIKSKMESYHAPEEEVTEGNEFGAERAKAIAAGKDSFTVDGKTYKVTDVDPTDKKNAEEFANESMKLSTLLKKKSVNEAAARLSDLLKQVASGSTSRIGSTKVDKKTAEKLLKIYNSGDVKMQNKFDGMSIDKVTSAFKPFMENKKLTNEVAPEGWEGTVKAMKDEPGVDNPYALAWWMKGKGYQSHKK